MKRRVLTTVVFVLLGAIVNVAVAWALECCVKPVGNHVQEASGWLPIDPPQVQQGRLLEAVIERRDAAGVTRLRSYVSWGDRSRPPAESITPDWAASQELRHLLSAGRMNLNASGWPCRTLLYRWDREPTRTASGQWGPLKTVIVGGVELPYFAHSPTPSGSPNVTYLRALPLCPIWPGFGINTAFYAVVLWLLFAVPSSLRRWRRIRRGLCPKCAYPVGTSEVCTECGMRVHKPRSQQSTIR